MFIRIQDVPRYERHLLFCSHPAVMTSRRPTLELADELIAINRSLAIHGEAVDDLAAPVAQSVTPIAGAA